jgi:hypothetical protein
VAVAVAAEVAPAGAASGLALAGMGLAAEQEAA